MRKLLFLSAIAAATSAGAWDFNGGPQSRPPASATAGGLKVGEYACYGSGGRIMAGLGFRVLAGGRYTDLEGGNAGTYRVSGGNVQFQGGHLGGQTGRILRNGSFAIGAQVECEPF